MGFAEPHWGRDGLPSLLAARGAVQELGQAALRPGVVWDGQGAACRDGAHCTGLRVLGTGAGAGVVSHGADPGVVLSGAEHHLRVLPQPPVRPAGNERGSAASPCVLLALHSALLPWPFLALATAVVRQGSAPCTWDQKVTPILVPVLIPIPVLVPVPFEQQQRL